MAGTLIFGNGWLGNRLARDLVGTITKADITERHSIRNALDEYKPEVVINAAGKTGQRTVDDCEDDPIGTIMVNTGGPILLAEECLRRKIYMVHLGSGCVYDNSRPKYTEEDPPNFQGSTYSRSKALSEAALKDLPVLQLRIRMPFDGTPSPRNLITKLLRYPRIIRVENSVTCVEDFVRVTQFLVVRREIGIWNIVNPEPITHPEILEMYRAIVNPDHQYEVMTLEELAKITKAGRSNCVLDTEKLERAGISLRPTRTAFEACFRQYKGGGA